MSLDIQRITAYLAELAEIDEKIADRLPIKVIPRTDAPDIPKLKARREAIFAELKVRRNYNTPKGHDLGGDGQPAGYDLGSIGIIAEVRHIPQGKDRALPKSTLIVLVGFPGGEHLWFDPSDIEAVGNTPVAEVAHGSKHPKKAGKPGP